MSVKVNTLVIIDSTYIQNKEHKFCHRSIFFLVFLHNRNFVIVQFFSCFLHLILGFECTENLIADEFSAELAEGVAYVAGHDEESRPVMVIFNSLSPSLY